MDVNRNFLTEDQQRLLHDWEELFKQPAWQYVIQRAAADIEQLTSILVNNAQTEADLHSLRARITTLRDFVTLEETLTAQFNKVVEDAEHYRQEIIDSQGANS